MTALPRRPVYHWPCGCVHDASYCEAHRHTPVIREGAALRTGDELAELFIVDAHSLLHPGGDLPAEWAVVLEACEEDHANGGAWLTNDDLSEELDSLLCTAEDQLTDAGWTVDWDDGYVIWRPTADAPPDELRRQREQQEALDG